MSMRLAQLTLAATLLLAACEPTPALRAFGPLDSALKSAMRSVPGAIQVRLRWEPGWTQQTTLRIEGGMVFPGHLAREPKTEESWRVSGGATMLKVEPSATIYRGPYAFSPDGATVAASIVPLNEHRPAQQVAVVDLREGRLVGEIRGPAGMQVHGLTWAPDGSHVAVLMLRPESGPGDPRSTASGHPNQSATFVLMIYRRDLLAVAQIELARSLRHAAAEVVWN